MSALAGVLSVFCPSAHLLRVDYDASVTTERDLVLQVRETGLDMECVVWMRVEGVRCRPSLQRVQEQLAALEGVSSVRGSLQERELMVTYGPLLVTQQDLRQHIRARGFSARPLADAALRCWQEVPSDWSAQSVTLRIAGMSCSSCSSSIQERLSQMGGVKASAVSLSEGTATVTFDPGLTEAELLRAAIADMGFEASLRGWFKSGLKAASVLRSRTDGSSQPPFRHAQPLCCRRRYHGNERSRGPGWSGALRGWRRLLGSKD